MYDVLIWSDKWTTVLRGVSLVTAEIYASRLHRATHYSICPTI